MLDLLRKPLERHVSLNLLRAVTTTTNPSQELESAQLRSPCPPPSMNISKTLPANVLARFPAKVRNSIFSDRRRPPAPPAPSAKVSLPTKQPQAAPVVPVNCSSMSIEQLQFESDIGHVQGLGSRLTDNPAHRHDFNLWWELLSFRMRHYGDRGVLDIWKGMTLRGGTVSLPIQGKVADNLWTTFIQVGTSNEEFLWQLCDYAKQLWQRESKRRKFFYVEVIGQIFRMRNKAMKTHKAIDFHHRLHEDFLVDPNQLGKLFPRAATTKKGLWIFKHICSDVAGHQIYQHVVPYLWRGQRFEEALDMHKFLVMRKDYPPISFDQIPLNRYMQKKDKDTEAIVKNLRNSNHVGGVGLERQRDQAQHSLRSIFEIVDGPKKSPFSDEFGARLFATKALSFDLVLSGFRLFSVKTIGPLSLREMAARAESPRLVAERIGKLKDAGIDLGDSTFTRVVNKLANERNAEVLADVLASDQHPDVLEDWKLQESLLAHYHRHSRTRDINRTMAILTVRGDNDSQETWNLLLRTYLTLRDWTLVKKTLENMSELQVPVTERSLVWMHQNILERRGRGKAPAPTKDGANDVLFLIRMWQKIVQSGGAIPSRLWKEALRRLGMSGRLRNLEQTVIWLASWYSRKHGQNTRNALVPRYSSKDVRYLAPVEPQLPGWHKESALRKIFTPGFMRSIVEWGFIWPRALPSNCHPPGLSQSEPSLAESTSAPSLSSHSNTSPIGLAVHATSSSAEVSRLMPEVWGLSLLKQVRDQYGVNVPTELVRRACRLRLQQLFGPYQHSRRSRNGRARARNQRELMAYIHAASGVWGSELFGDLARNQNWGRLVNPATRASLQKAYLKRCSVEGWSAANSERLLPVAARSWRHRWLRRQNNLSVQKQ